MDLTLHGAPLRGLTDYELRVLLDRMIVLAADAQRYSPSETMYRDEVRKLIREQERRHG